MALTPRQLIDGRYRLLEAVGQGGMGRVWRAHDELLDRVVAIKELILSAALTEEERSMLYKRCIREAKSAARLNHRSVVTVHDILTSDHSPLIVMEFIVGRSLSDITRIDGPLPPLKVAEIGVAVLGALSEAHAAGIIHRDVKSSNVIIAENRVVLTDFGIAGLEGDAVLTQSGVFIGTPAFMAPEQAKGKAASPASDMWSFGVTLYESVEGHLPFSGGDFLTVLSSLLTEDPLPARRAGPLMPLLDGLLCKDPTERLDAQQAGNILTKILSSEPSPRLPNDHPQTVTALSSAPAAEQVKTFTAPRVTPQLRHATLAGHLAIVNSVVFSPNGRLLASCSRDQTARVWDVVTHTQSTVLNHSSSVSAAAFSPNGKVLAVVGDDKVVHLWNVARGKRGSTLDPGHTDKVNSVIFSQDAKVLVSAGQDGTVCLWDIGTPRWTGMRKGTPVMHSDVGHSFFAVGFSPDGSTLGGANSDGSVWLWDFKSAREWDVGKPSPLRGRLWHDSPVIGLAFNPNGRTLATCTQAEAIVWIWDIVTHEKLASIRSPSPVSALAFSPDGALLATGGVDQAIRLWNPVTRKQLAEPLTGHTQGIRSIAFSPYGSLFATGAADHTIRLWDITQILVA